MGRALLLAALALLLAAPAAAARIAFVSERGGEPEIYVMADDGSGETDLSDDPATPDVAPAWSPDGGRIVFQHGIGPDADIWVMDADGRDQRALVATPASELAPSWSVDGRIAYISDDQLLVADQDGDNARRLDTGAADPADPAFSPDGASIAYWDSDAELIHVIGADGTGDHVVGGPPRDAIGGDQTPAWSADGRRILFAGLREPETSYDIFSMNLDGGDQRPLVASPDREIDPAVSGDGRLAYATDAADDYDISVDGRRLTTADGDDTAPAWAPLGASQPMGGTQGPAGPAGGAGGTGLRVTVSYARSRILVYPRRLSVGIRYRLNRPATLRIHLYLHNRLVGAFSDRGASGPNVARWRHRIAGPARWKGTYTVAVVSAVEPGATRRRSGGAR